MHAARIAADLARSRPMTAPTDANDDLLAEVRVVAGEIKVVHSYSGLLGLCGFCWGVADLVQDAWLLVEVRHEPFLLYSVATSVCVTTMVSLAIAVAILREVRKENSEADEWLMGNCKIPETWSWISSLRSHWFASSRPACMRLSRLECFFSIIVVDLPRVSL
jgi:hypothetical protein